MDTANSGTPPSPRAVRATSGEDGKRAIAGAHAHDHGIRTRGATDRQGMAGKLELLDDMSKGDATGTRQ